MTQKIIVGDTESDGFVEEATQIWCGSFLELGKDEMRSFTPLSSSCYQQTMVNWLYEEMMEGAFFVCHNVIKHDAPLIRKLTGVILPPEGLVDSLILSKMFFPDIKGHKAPHSIEAWGERFGIPKPEHEDWSQYSEEMLHRNQEDLRINVELFHKLQKKGFKL